VPTTKYTLGYWNTRGITQPIRYVLEYGGFDYQETRYKGDDWFQETKPKMYSTFAFPNLPYLENKEENVYLSQSKAILLYLAGKSNLLPLNEEDKARADMHFFSN